MKEENLEMLIEEYKDSLSVGSDLGYTESWSYFRDPEEKYVLKEIFFPFGVRRCYFKNENLESNYEYEMLQNSRGISFTNDCIKEEIIESVKNDSSDVIDSDILRINEIDKFLTIREVDIKSFSELGFRIPKLANFYQKKYGVKAYNYDISSLNVEIAKHLGYSAIRYDFNDCKEFLDLSESDLVVSYHMLEHLSDPTVAIKKIFKSMKNKAVFHVEVPIETGTPRIRFGHMFPFSEGDLCWMLSDAGFIIENFSTNTHPEGVQIERYIAVKPDYGQHPEYVKLWLEE